jgi:PIF1-like helicase
MLYEDQIQAVTVVMDTLYEFMHMKDPKSFKPLRIIINGQGGSGKSVVINTLVTLIRKMFDVNEVVKVVAPTGVAAFNVKGETFHHAFHMGVSKREHKANTLPMSTRLKMIAKFKNILCLIIDERSLVSSKVLGTCETLMSETLHEGGHHSNDSWGGIPVVIMVGDDYQLPGIGEGAFSALFSTYGSKMVFKGRKALLECSEYVLNLEGSKRVKENESETKLLLDRVRLGTDITESDVDKLMSLHLDSMQKRHGSQVVADIEQRALYLFYRNDKRIHHNLLQLVKRCSDSNPVAMIRSKSIGPQGGKGIKRHFDSDLPGTALLCIDCKVAMHSRNLKPSWGLHNGACGTVREIVFSPGKNPNNGDDPEYVVVEFPLYCGPAWDKGNHKVGIDD